MKNVYVGSVGCKMYITEQAEHEKWKMLHNCWVQNVYDVQNVYEGSVGCKMYIMEHVEHEKWKIQINLNN